MLHAGAEHALRHMAQLLSGRRAAGPLDGGAGYTQQRMQRMMLGIRGHLGPCCDNVLQCEAAIMGLAQVRHNCEALGVHS